MRFILPLLFFLIGHIATAQTVLLEQDCDTTVLPSRYGPNRPNFLYINGSVALPLYRGEGARYIAWKSPTWHLGVHYKRKFSEMLSGLCGIQYAGFSYFLRQSGPKVYPDTTYHHSQGFRGHSLGLCLALRVQMARRGNALGSYIDIGVEGEWLFSSIYHVTDKLPGGIKQKVVTRGLPLYNPWQGDVFLRYGWGTYALVARGRLTSLFKNELNAPEPPRVTVGIEVGWGI